MCVVIGGGRCWCAAAGPARRGDDVILPRPGRSGIGVRAATARCSTAGDLGEEFGSGPRLAVRLRYRMRYERGLGLSFESQRFDVRGRDR